MTLMKTKHKLALAAVTMMTLSAAQLVARSKPATQPVAGPSVLASDVGSPLKMTMNKSQVLTTKTPYARVSVSQPEIADVNLVGPTSILVTAKKVGSTQVII